MEVKTTHESFNNILWTRAHAPYTLHIQISASNTYKLDDVAFAMWLWLWLWLWLWPWLRIESNFPIAIIWFNVFAVQLVSLSTIEHFLFTQSANKKGDEYMCPCSTVKCYDVFHFWLTTCRQNWPIKLPLPLFSCSTCCVSKCDQCAQPNQIHFGFNLLKGVTYSHKPKARTFWVFFMCLYVCCTHKKPQNFPFFGILVEKIHILS